MTPKELFNQHKTDVLKRAHNLARKYRYSFDDMRQELLKTLWSAACDFKPSLGVPFYPYLQQRMTWDALHIAFPKTDNHKPETISLNEYDDVDLINLADDYAESIAGGEGDYRLMSRAAEILEIVNTSKDIKPEERKALRKLIQHFEEGTEMKTYSTSLRNGLKKIRLLLNVPSLSPMPYSVDHKQLVTDILELTDENEIIVLDIHRQLITRSPYKEMGKKGLGLQKLQKELARIGVKLFNIPGQGSKFNPLRFHRSELKAV